MASIDFRKAATEACRTALGGRAGGVAVLVVISAAVYLPASVLRGTETLFGWDFTLLHARRLRFLRDAIMAHLSIPAWSPREMMGAPFSANLQNVPWIPSHWVLLLFHPDYAYAAGVAFAAILSALFTYLFCRQMGFSAIASICAGWTFASAGFFAARVMIGQLLILEGYCALPLLVWLAGSAIDIARRRDLAALAIATALVAMAGHPQLPAYAVGAAMAYATVFGRGPRRRQAFLAIVLGLGMSLVAWWPMLLLIRRSTRVLPLDISANDITMTVHRLLVFLAPGIDGYPDGVEMAASHPLRDASNPAFFWDAFAYCGLVPIAAAAIFVVLWALGRRPDSRLVFLGALGLAGVIGSLPLLDPVRNAIPPTIFRSPARLLYFTTFFLAVAAGALADLLMRARWWWRAAGIACLAFHAYDLGSVARGFVLPTSWHPLDLPEFERIAASDPAARVAVSRIVSIRLQDDRDDPGGYDSVFLADPYRAMLARTGLPARLNEEVMDASTWPAAALEAMGARFVITPAARGDIEAVGRAGDLQMYRVPGVKARCDARYERPASDAMVIRTNGDAHMVHILESYDPGWSATIDGHRAPVAEWNGFAMEIHVQGGTHD